jgi:hypothetical protein
MQDMMRYARHDALKLFDIKGNSKEDITASIQTLYGT